MRTSKWIMVGMVLICGFNFLYAGEEWDKTTKKLNDIPQNTTAPSMAAVPVVAGKEAAITEIIGKLKKAQTKEEKESLDMTIREFKPKTESDARVLFEAMDDKQLASASWRALSNVRYEDRQLAPVFIENLNNRNKTARLLAIEMVGKFKAKEAVPELMEIAKKTPIKHVLGIDEGGMVIAKSLMSLGEIGDESAMPVIISRLKDFGTERTGGTGGAAGFALQMFGKKAVAPILREAKTNKDEDVRKIATYLIRGINDKEAAPDLLEVVKDTTNPLEIRQNAIEALGYIGDKESAQQMVAIFSNEKELSIRAYILSAFRHNKNRDGIPLAFKGLSDNDPIIRGSAAIVLGEVCIQSDDLAIAALEKALNDSDKETRILASRALKKITGKDYDWRKK